MGNSAQQCQCSQSECVQVVLLSVQQQRQPQSWGHNEQHGDLSMPGVRRLFSKSLNFSSQMDV